MISPQAPIVAKLMGFLGSNVFCVSSPAGAVSMHKNLTCYRQMAMNGELAILSLHTPESALRKQETPSPNVCV
jgi:hypothetical protein